MQTRRNAGKEYTKYRGKGAGVAARTAGADCNCKKKCFEEVSEADRANIFTNFWKMATFDLQNTYLRGCIRACHTKRKTKGEGSSRTRTFQYALVSKTVCKVAFLNIHGLQTSRGRLENITKNMEAVTPPMDGRGRHGKHLRKYTDADVQFLRTFIEKIPRYKSHYSRKDAPKREYLGMEYSIEACYCEYNTFCKDSNKSCVSRDKFRRIFTEEFNISFKNPKTDTCNICDTLNISLLEATKLQDHIKATQIKQEQEIHHRRAQAGQEAIKISTEEAKAADDIVVITFDLQQALPTPKLATGPVFYKRKLWCYNLSVHCCSSKQGYFFMWDEATAGRGADEITSCLQVFFEENDIRGKKLIAISDNCGGQNKNWTVVGFWMRLLAEGRFDEIIHIFPQVGHTMLPSDRDFAIVENYVRSHCQMVYSPDEWEEVLKKSQKKTPFKVCRMTQEKFLRFSDLRGSFYQPLKTNKGEKVCFRSIVKMRFTVEKECEMMISRSYAGGEENLTLRKRGRPVALRAAFLIDIPKKYAGVLPIDALKLRDVMSCMQWVPSVHHGYYNTLVSKAAVRESDSGSDE